MAEWISVKDRMPGPYARVLAWVPVPGFGIEMARFEPHRDAWLAEDDEPCEKVTHWMPLPEPPGAAAPRRCDCVCDHREGPCRRKAHPCELLAGHEGGCRFGCPAD